MYVIDATVPSAFVHQMGEGNLAFRMLENAVYTTCELRCTEFRKLQQLQELKYGAAI